MIISFLLIIIFNVYFIFIINIVVSVEIIYLILISNELSMINIRCITVYVMINFMNDVMS